MIKYLQDNSLTSTSFLLLMYNQNCEQIVNMVYSLLD